MSDSTDTTDQGGIPHAALRRLLFVLPVLAFLVLAVALAIGLGRDPSLVPSPLIGKPAPATALEPVPGFGPGFSNADFEGWVSLVNVFASWCVSCRDEHPLLVRLAEEEGVAIYGLAYKDAPEDAAGWLADFGNPYAATGLDLDGRAAIDWGVYGVPETFLVGPDGTIVWKKIGPVTPEEVTQEILPRVASLAVSDVATTTTEGQVATGGDAEEPAMLPNLSWLDEPVPLPDTPFLLADGRTATFADFQGKAIVLNFWATWCLPCREEMPSLDRLAAAHGGEDLVVIPMSLDRGDAAPILAFYEEIGARNLALFHDPDMALSRELKVFGLPTTLLVDYRGLVVAQLVGTAEWDSRAALDAILPLAEEARVARAGGAQQAQGGD